MKIMLTVAVVYGVVLYAIPRLANAQTPQDTPQIADRGIAILTFDQESDYNKMAKVHVESFKKYQSIIGDKESSDTKRDKAVLHAQDMFLNSNQTIEVGWLAGNTLQKQSFKVKDYFQRFRQRSRNVYSQTKVSDFKPYEERQGFKEQGNGVYKATFRFFQKFEGFVAGNVFYSDETTKDIEMYAMPNGGEVKMGNIRVVDIENVVNKSRSGGGERMEGLPTGNPRLLESVRNAGAKTVHILGTRGTLLKKLSFDSFKEKCEFGEFDVFAFEKISNGIAIVRMK